MFAIDGPRARDSTSHPFHYPTSSEVTVTRVSVRGGDGRDSPLTFRGSTKVILSDADDDVAQQELPMLQS